MTSPKRTLSIIAGMLLILAVLPAKAAFISLTPDASGQLSASGGLFGNSSSHTVPLTTIRGYQTQQFQVFQWASYLIFDTSALAFTPTFGTLSFSVDDTLDDLAGPGPLQLWGLDVCTPADILALPVGSLTGQPVGCGAGIDLRSGTSLAPDIIGPDGMISFQLNNAALSQVAGSGGLFGVGLYDDRFGGLIGGVDILSTPTLFLSNEIVAPVPAPATPAIIALALILLRFNRRSRRT